MGYLGCISQQSKGAILTDIRKQIIDLDRVAPVELRNVYRNHEGLRGQFVEKNDVLMEAEQVLTDGELIKAFRACITLRNYQFKGAIIRQAATMEFAGRLERDGKDLGFR